MLSERQDLDQRVFALSFFMGEKQGHDVLKMIVTAPDMVCTTGLYRLDKSKIHIFLGQLMFIAFF